MQKRREYIQGIAKRNEQNPRPPLVGLQNETNRNGQNIINKQFITSAKKRESQIAR